MWNFRNTRFTAMTVQRYHPGHLWLPCSVGREFMGEVSVHRPYNPRKTVRRKI
jgi:hypothetical protein